MPIGGRFCRQQKNGTNKKGDSQLPGPFCAAALLSASRHARASCDRTRKRERDCSRSWTSSHARRGSAEGRGNCLNRETIGGMEWCKKDEEGEMIMTEPSSLSDGMDHLFCLQLESQATAEFLSLCSHNSSPSPACISHVNSNFLIPTADYFSRTVFLSPLCGDETCSLPRATCTGTERRRIHAEEEKGGKSSLVSQGKKTAPQRRKTYSLTLSGSR